ncbi:hypothetical protein SAMN04487965_3548 [Microbulbifer donghaiensis]|uniref:Uncharacterized protein n=1 Tax=Microbulbifer donghaiensis TaxID=494016 RepID=A0A1M5I2C3_9GAMM|nr:hypothetical protein [Microbulbifer donghaiensis]SHG22391.1 hypothetical protein SAMN04487965_3548 [Microbulbifer donghaiensis]
MVTVVATDDAGAAGEAYAETVRVGPEPPQTAPELSNIAASSIGQCVTVSGNVVDKNLDLDTVEVSYSNGTVTAAVTGTDFTAEQCNLPGGTGSAQVTASDLTGLSASASVSFTVDAGATATLDAHIAAGRLDYTNYANCYLEYSTSPFRLDEYSAAAGQCQWRDDDASCVGPQLACSSGEGNGGDSGDSGGDNGSSNCTEASTYNYYHKTAGRAYSTGNPLAPDYFANGSGESMPGSTWGLNTLHSEDSSWYLGPCP